MNPTYRKLFKALHDKYPDKHICITIENNYYDHTDEYKTQYYVYVADGEAKFLPTLSEVKLYVEHLCKKEAKK